MFFYLKKTQICDTNIDIVGNFRRWETLTGREIEMLWNIETNLQLTKQKLNK
jgi:hypothetical protein